jgi:hypothetical protein
MFCCFKECLKSRGKVIPELNIEIKHKDRRSRIFHIDQSTNYNSNLLLMNENSRNLLQNVDFDKYIQKDSDPTTIRRSIGKTNTTMEKVSLYGNKQNTFYELKDKFK